MRKFTGKYAYTLHYNGGMPCRTFGTFGDAVEYMRVDCGIHVDNWEPLTRDTLGTVTVKCLSQPAYAICCNPIARMVRS